MGHLSALYHHIWVRYALSKSNMLSLVATNDIQVSSVEVDSSGDNLLSCCKDNKYVLSL